MANDYMDEIKDRDDRVHKIEVEDTKWTLTAHNPYGLIKITRKDGRVPAILNGQYTSNHQAEIAITRYVNGQLRDENNKVQAKSDRIESAIYKKPRVKKAPQPENNTEA